MGSYIFKWPYTGAHEVYVSGTFDDWGKTAKLDKVGEVFEKEIELPSATDKVLYKFVVDNEWMLDEAAPKEDDGHFNVNNVLLPEHIKPKATHTEAASDPSAAFISSAAPVSSTAALAAGVPKVTESAPTTSTISSAAPESTTAALAAGVPKVDESAPITSTISSAAPESTTAALAASVPKVDDSAPITSTISSAAPESTTAALAADVPKVDDSAPVASAISSAAPESSTAALADGVPKVGESAPLTSTISSAAPESTTAAQAGEEELEKTRSVPGGFPETETPATEPDSFSVNPIPASTGIGNPQTGDLQSSSINDAVTTSKEDYEKAGQEGEQTFGVAPIPASAGIGNPKPGEAQAGSVNDTATTSKEAYDKAGQEEEKTFGVAPIPASTGLGNPKDGDVHASSVNDTVTTSKEDYEKAGSSAIPIVGGLAAATAGIGAAGAAAFAAHSDKKNLIPESSLPMGEDAGKGVDIGPTLSSVGPQSTTASLAAAVPLQNKRQGVVIDPADAPPEEIKQEVKAVDDELLSKVKRSEATGEPASAAKDQTSYYGLPTSVPKPVEESEKAVHASPEASADASVVHEKSLVERELLEKVPTTDATGEPAPTITAATSDTAPAPSQTTTIPATDGAADQTLANEPAIKYINQNDAAAAAPVAAAAGIATEKSVEKPGKKATEKAAETVQEAAPAPSADSTPANAAATPQKTVEPETPRKAVPAPSAASTPAKAATTPQKTVGSATGSPANGGTPKDKKRRHRISAFFKKIFD